MKKLIIALGVVLSLGFMTSCNEDDTLSSILLGDGDSTNIADGLKEALRVGTDTATSLLGVENGYFGDAAVRILLPGEVSSTLANFRSQTFTIPIPFLDDRIVTGEEIYTQGLQVPLIGIDIQPLAARENDLILGINRAAEAAANEAGPIFGEAITNITIQDANNILFGGVDTAATNFLRVNTFGNLFNNFEPRIDNALNSVQIGGVSVVSEYEAFVNSYNDIVNTNISAVGSLGSLVGLESIAAADLSEFSTGRALDGLFLRVSEEEADIRQNPLARINDLLQSVFGQLD